MRGSLIAVFVAALLAPAAASATTVPMDVVPLTPASGGSATGGPEGTAVPFSVRLDDIFGSESVVVTIAKAATTTPDGILDPANKVGAGDLPASETDGNTYTGSASGAFSATPAVYYFQFSYASSGAECGTVGNSCIVISKVFPMTVVAPGPGDGTGGGTTPAPGDHLRVWPLADALPLVKPIITKGAKRTPRNLTRSCHRAGAFGFQCITAWGDSRYKWRGTLALRINSTTREVNYRWSGTRATNTCLKKHSRTKCKFDWAF